MSRRSLWIAVPVAALLIFGAVAWLIWRDAHRRVEALTEWIESGRSSFVDHINKQWRLRRDVGM